MILVTGSNGFLGSAVVHRLAAEQELPIRCLVRAGSSTKRLDELLADERYADKIEIFRGDLSRPDDCPAMLDGVKTLYHLAAGMGGGAMADTWQATVVATDNLLASMHEQAREGNPIGRMVHCSSFAVYDAGSLARGMKVDEETPTLEHLAVADNYGHAKLRQEQLVRETAQELSLSLTVVRPGVVYGPGGGEISRRVGIRQGSLLVAFGGSNLLPLSYVDNCAEAMVHLGRQTETIGETYNIHDDVLITASEFWHRYKRQAGPLKVLPVPKLPGRGLAHAVAKYSEWSKGQLPAALTPEMYKATWQGNTFDNTKLRLTGWQQSVSTNEGLDRHFAAIANQGER